MSLISNASFRIHRRLQITFEKSIPFAFKPVRFCFSSTLNSDTREILCAKCTLPNGESEKPRSITANAESGRRGQLIRRDLVMSKNADSELARSPI